MMQYQSHKEILEEASRALELERYQVVLEKTHELIELNVYLVDAYTLKGIALAKLDRNDDATIAFQKAIECDQLSAKAHYNYATHLFYIGRMTESRRELDVVLTLNPKFDGADELQEALGLTDTPEPKSTQRETLPKQRKPLEQFIENLGSRWVTIGWIIALATLAMILYLNFRLSPEVIKLVPKNPSFDQIQKATMKVMEADPMFFGAMNITLTLVYISSIAWLALDIIAKGGKLIWLVPLVLVTFLTKALTWLVLIAYILFIRKRIGQKTDSLK
jgi:tetratricopeptide (TPR) repeat protein